MCIRDSTRTGQSTLRVIAFSLVLHWGVPRRGVRLVDICRSVGLWQDDRWQLHQAQSGPLRLLDEVGGVDGDIERPVTVGLVQADRLIAIGWESLRTTPLILSAASNCMHKRFAASVAAVPGQESEVGSFHVCRVESGRLARCVGPNRKAARFRSSMRRDSGP